MVNERSRATGSGAALFGLILAAVVFASHLHAEGLRFEAAGGTCKYGKAQDGTWWKTGYETDLHLQAHCFSLGVSQMVFDLPGSKLGWRASYVDFGLAKAKTFVPVRDDEANDFPTGQHCDPATFSGCVGEYKQEGKARGLAFGPVLEKKFDRLTLGAETGIFHYYSFWKVDALQPGPGTCDTCTPMPWSWNGAAGWHTTWYVGGTLEYNGFFLQARRYHATYASQATVTNNPLAIGLIAGPLYSVQLGYQFKF